MKGKNLMKGLSMIDPKYIYEAEFDSLGAKKKPRKPVVLALAACLLFALGVTAYAVNLLGIQEMFRTERRELPTEAVEFIQQETVSGQAEDWSCEITESLSDDSTVMLTIRVLGGDKYIIVPEDVNPDYSIGAIGMTGEQTLEELAQALGKKLLHVGAHISKIGGENTAVGSNYTKNISESEMMIFAQSAKQVQGYQMDAECIVYAREAGSDDVQRIPLTVALQEAPGVQEGKLYHPVNPEAIPGLILGDLTASETPLGINLRLPETVNDVKALYNIRKVEFEGITLGEGGSILGDDGEWYFQANMCKGTLGDTMKVSYYDSDNVLIGEIEFRLK